MHEDSNFFILKPEKNDDDDISRQCGIIPSLVAKEKVPKSKKK